MVELQEGVKLILRAVSRSPDILDLSSIDARALNYSRLLTDLQNLSADAMVITARIKSGEYQQKEDKLNLAVSPTSKTEPSSRADRTT